MSEPGDGSVPTAAPTDMLIDRYLPRFDVTLIEHTVADADVVTTWRALAFRPVHHAGDSRHPAAGRREPAGRFEPVTAIVGA